jgi:NTP pyrophosphatase (non-canonical NTP hydrolase)
MDPFNKLNTFTEAKPFEPELSRLLNLDHQAMVSCLLKPAADIFNSLDALKINLLHGAVGVSGEAGELLDAVKKGAFYNKPFDRENIVEELGDLEFYMQAVRKELNITREETLKHNMNKLAERYKNYKYSDQQAIDRADKKE